MKRQVSLVSLLCCILGFVSSCEKAPFLVLNSPNSITFTEQGGTQKVSFTANRDWTVSSSESWCKISPLSGLKSEGELSFTVTCDPNTTYDPRNATVTIKAEELMESISVIQDTNLGMLVSQTSYGVSSAEQTIDVEVKANVNYIVDIPSDCKDWISHISTKSLTSRTLVLKISENKDYDNRTGYLTIRQTDGPLAETITINQKQADGLFITTPEYELSNDAHTLSVEVKANVQYVVTPQVDWIKYVETKALDSSIVSLAIDANETYDDRTGTVLVKQVNGNMAGTIYITQKQTDYLYVEKTEFCISCDDQILPINVQSNVAYEVKSEVDWVEVVETKTVSHSEVILHVSENVYNEDRTGTVRINQIDGDTNVEVRILQEAAAVSNDPIPFKDPLVKKVCVEKYDKDGDGELSYREASLVTNVGYDKFFGNYQKIVTSFDEFAFFTSVTQISGGVFSGAEKLKSISLPPDLTDLGNNTFEGCAALKEVIVPEGVKVLNGTFFGCESLEAVSFAVDLTKIGDYTFHSCNNLKEINIPNTVTEIGRSAFYGCESIKEITIPEGIKELKRDALGGLLSVETVNLPNSLEIIGEYALYCSGFKHIRIPANVVLIDMGAFSGCTNLESIDFPSSNVIIGDVVFEGCSSLREISLPSTVVSLGIGVFRKTGLESISIPESVKEIGYDQFFGCLNLKSIRGYFASEDERCLIKDGVLLGFAQQGLTTYTTPPGIKSIRTSMFGYDSSYTHNDLIEELTISEGVETIDIWWGILTECTKIRTLNLPASLKELSYNSLGNVRHYYTIYCKAIDPPIVPSGMFQGSYFSAIYVPMESVIRYKEAPGWSDVASRIQAIPYTIGEIDGLAYVDMGNGLKWATCNIGANSPEEYGQYFAWGEVKQKADYSESKYDYNKEFEDAASINWGATWRMPTEEEWAWLLDNCDWNWTEDKGVKGYRVASRATGNSIFLPAAGFYDNTALVFIGRSGLYWSSSSPGSETFFKKYVALHDEKAFLSDGNRFNGLSVRPVSE